MSIHDFIDSNLTRTLLSGAVLVSATLATRGAAHFLRKRSELDDQQSLREWHVLSRNLIWASATLGLFVIWMSELKTIALSVAAFAAALLLVAKEAISNFLGTLTFAIARPFQIGDIIEIAGQKGRVVGVDAMSTTILESGPGGRFGGETVRIPNYQLLTQPIRNLTHTKQFVLSSLKFQVPSYIGADKLEEVLLKAAEAEIYSWKKEATAHFEKFQDTHLLNLPSAHPKVLLESSDGDATNGSRISAILYYPVMPDKRVSTDQKIMRTVVAVLEEARVLSLFGG